MQLKIDDRAISEFNHSYSYYENESGQGDLFYQDYKETIKRLSENPYSYQTLDKSEYRRCTFKTFSHAIFYKIMIDHLYIIAIAHQKQKPDYWKDRNN